MRAREQETSVKHSLHFAQYIYVTDEPKCGIQFKKVLEVVFLTHDFTVVYI